MKLDCAGKPLDLDLPQVVGILNVTPDSFSDGARFMDPEAAVVRGRQLVAEGAAVVDVGAESTRPGAVPVPARVELDRLIPVVEALSAELPVPISVDTSKADVMEAAVAAGAGLINDVYALRLPGALEVVRDLGVPVCLMHMQGTPATMQDRPRYREVVAEVLEFLTQRLTACQRAGIAQERLLVDPGFGFGKTDAHNLLLLKHLEVFRGLGCPILVGLSRKGVLGRVLGRALDARLAGGVAAAALAVWQGASLVRTHDVAATLDAVRWAHAVRSAGTASAG
ncbi:MAG: dihydropteroate synthase [Chromatiales bacterium 21-64-14]|nr:MAG: dihydropteroate synthase [Chromatiales bacterium 21-64-14]HQU15432.1 dihydropteroate synthase [Gammaproteobacteria bacterium]